MQEATLRALDEARRVLAEALRDAEVAPLLAHVMFDLDALVATGRAPAGAPPGRAAQERHLATLLRQTSATSQSILDVLWCTLEQAPLAIMAVDQDARVRLWNPACERLFGWSAEEALGQTPPYLAPEQVPDFRASFERVRAGGRLIGVPMERRARDGRRLELELWTTALHDASGVFLGAIGMIADVSGRRLLERELAARERLLDAVFELLPVGVWILDPAGMIERGNPAALRIWGGARWVGPERYDEYRAWRVDTGAPLSAEDWAVYRAISRGETSAGELLRIQRFDGAFRTIIHWALPLRDDGRITGAIAVNEDVTALQETKEALDRALAREQRLRRTIEAVGDTAARVSDAVVNIADSTFVGVLRALAEGAREVLQADFVAVAVSDDGPPDPSRACLVIGGSPDAPAPGTKELATLPGWPVTAASTLRLDDLRRHPAFRGFPAGVPALGPLLATPLRFRDARLGTMLLGKRPGAPPFTADDEHTIDILTGRAAISVETARLYEAEALQRAFLQAVIDQIPLGVVLVDRAGRPLAVNCAALELVGAERSADDPLHAFELRAADGERLPDDRLPLARALAQGEVVRGEELVLRTRQGADVAVLANAVPVRGPGGGPAGAATTFQDITALKELERLRVEWASVVAHDLRAPIGTIHLAAQLLGRAEREGEGEDGRSQRALEHITNAVARLNRMVDDLSDVSQLEAHRLPVRPRRIDLGALAKDVAERVAALVTGLRVSVRAEEQVSAWADPARVEQVLTNLLTNAARYGEPGSEVVVDVLAREHEAELVVTNRGRGIPPDELPHVFERFTRSATRADVPGLGLGLYICKGLVEAQRGRIWVESTPGATTRFHVTLPLA